MGFGLFGSSKKKKDKRKIPVDSTGYTDEQKAALIRFRKTKAGKAIDERRKKMKEVMDSF